MRTLPRYFLREIFQTVFFILLSFITLLAFFDVLNEMKSVESEGYTFIHALYYVLLGMPGNAYDYMPLSVLIGTIFVMARFAARSEFTVMRVSGLSTPYAIIILLKIGLLFVLFTFFLGEIIAPFSFKVAEKYKMNILKSMYQQNFQSGLWTKDHIREGGLSGPIIGSRFINVDQVTMASELIHVTYYEFDRDFRLLKQVKAQKATYQQSSVWKLQNVEITDFPRVFFNDAVSPIKVTKQPFLSVISEVTPTILLASSADNNTDRMPFYDLKLYTEHLVENKQDASKFEIALWKKVTHPMAILVMMALALPFAYLHIRSGGVSLKIFVGIMVGVIFYLFNTTFSHLGLLHTWPPFITAFLPSILFLLLATVLLWWVEHH